MEALVKSYDEVAKCYVLIAEGNKYLLPQERINYELKVNQEIFIDDEIIYIGNNKIRLVKKVRKHKEKL